jgi:hypothetical protein
MRVPVDIWNAAHDFGALVHVVSAADTVTAETCHLETTAVHYEDAHWRARSVYFETPREALAWLLFSGEADAKYIRRLLLELRLDL